MQADSRSASTAFLAVPAHPGDWLRGGAAQGIPPTPPPSTALTPCSPSSYLPYHSYFLSSRGPHLVLFPAGGTGGAPRHSIHYFPSQGHPASLPRLETTLTRRCSLLTAAVPLDVTTGDRQAGGGRGRPRSLGCHGGKRLAFCSVLSPPLPLLLSPAIGSSPRLLPPLRPLSPSHLIPLPWISWMIVRHHLLSLNLDLLRLGCILSPFPSSLRPASSVGSPPSSRLSPPPSRPPLAIPLPSLVACTPPIRSLDLQPASLQG